MDTTQKQIKHLDALKLATNALNTIQHMRGDAAYDAHNVAREALEDILECLTGEGNDEAKSD
jgi:hypothetical protein